MLALKLGLTPLLVGLISLAQRRWGAKISGWLVGLPLTSAPVTLFVALEQGPIFASQLAQAILLGLISQTLFCLSYGWLSFWWGWAGCWVVSWSLFFAATFSFNQFKQLPFLLLLGLVVVVLLVALKCWPRTSYQTRKANSSGWEILGRMVIATGLVLGLSSAAPMLGPHLSGLLSPLPVFATIFAIFTQRFEGQGPALQVLRGVLISSFSCAGFFGVISLTIGQWGVFASFGSATLLAFLTQGLALRLFEPSTYSRALHDEAKALK